MSDGPGEPGTEVDVAERALLVRPGGELPGADQEAARRQHGDVAE
ncbi:hypothetical protein [Streptomyces sp. NPDC002394]